ncbi:hypothetical protein CBR_g18574 [Chara braunii]|uniref:Protein kinase domain-containing protein n=1 Tax=Chara braunii TaxID=69332 RepID=A0A388JT89_CHABU|nr:hypothetical protein CBR_g18574 [Chara braunii]|eukprot:GBG60977.1 hypothetical protein CBR_g18574 [Chara braunii]
MNLVKSQEFRQELKILNRVHHKHLVELIGFCKENFLFLVYEYCEQGTLASHLHAPAAYGALTWITRIQAASDAAQALEYIHDHTRPTYVHRDIKSNNILLDKNLRAKVADFGLIKLIGQDDGHGPLTTKLVGTFGYMAPEYVKFGDLSPKSDVYSFGVVLLELLTGLQALNMMSTQSFPTSGSSFEHRKALTDLVVPLIKEMKSDKEVAPIVDPQLRDNYAVSAAFKLAHLAAQCLSDSPHERPDMKRIVYILDEILKLSQDGPEASETLDMQSITDSLAR